MPRITMMPPPRWAASADQISSGEPNFDIWSGAVKWDPNKSRMIPRTSRPAPSRDFGITMRSMMRLRMLTSKHPRN